MKLLKAKQDYIFKRIFGVEENKELLIAFLNAVFRDRGLQEVRDLQLVNPFNDKEFEEDKLSVLDIKARTMDGEWIDVEMQLQPVDDMSKRALYYGCRMVVDQLSEGEDYHKLRRTIVVSVLDYNYLPHRNLHSMYRLVDTETGHVATDVLELHFLELPKLRYVMQERPSRLMKWLLFLSGRRMEQWEEYAMDEPELKKAIETLQYLSRDAETRQKYEVREKALRDERSRLIAAERKGEQAGLRKGRVEGKLEGKRQTAVNMLRAGMSPEMVAQFTELPLDEVERLV